MGKDFIKLCFSKGLGRFYALNRMHFINTVSDGPHLNPLSIHAQVTWLPWSNSSIFQLSQDGNFEAVCFLFLLLSSDFCSLIAFQHNSERQRGNLTGFAEQWEWMWKLWVFIFLSIQRDPSFPSHESTSLICLGLIQRLDGSEYGLASSLCFRFLVFLFEVLWQEENSYMPLWSSLCPWKFVAMIPQELLWSFQMISTLREEEGSHDSTSFFCFQRQAVCQY